jgi:hypothetical protein
MRITGRTMVRASGSALEIAIKCPEVSADLRRRPASHSHVIDEIAFVLCKMMVGHRCGSFRLKIVVTSIYGDLPAASYVFNVVLHFRCEFALTWYVSVRPPALVPLE